MGHALFWIEMLACGLLLNAALLGCIARVCSPGRRWTLAMFVVVPAILFWGGTTFGFFLITEFTGLARFDFILLLMALAVLLAVCFLQLRRGLVRKAEDGSPAGIQWPRAKLAILSAVAGVLGLMTFWNMDLNAQNQMAMMRAEAGSLFLSAAPVRPPDADNAALLYQRAFDRMGIVSGKPSPEWLTKVADWLTKAEEPVTEDEVAGIVNQQRSTIELLHKAAGMKGCYFERNWSRPSPELLLPEMGPLRNAAKLLAADARLQTFRGHPREALQDIQALYMMADHLSREPLLISLLVGIAIENMAFTAFQDVLDRTHPTADDLAALNLPETFSFQKAGRRAFKGEEAFGLSCFGLFGSEIDFSDFLGMIVIEGNHPTRTKIFDPLAAPFYRVFILREDAAIYKRLMAMQQRAVEMPFPQAREESKKFEEELCRQKGFISGLTLPATWMITVRTRQAEAQYQLTELGLAAANYRAKNGRLPATLSALTAAATDLPVADPFDGQPIRLKQIEGGGILLYSVGPDLADDGGKAYDRETRKGDFVLRIKP